MGARCVLDVCEMRLRCVSEWVWLILAGLILDSSFPLVCMNPLLLLPSSSPAISISAQTKMTGSVLTVSARYELQMYHNVFSATSRKSLFEFLDYNKRGCVSVASACV